MRTVAQDFWESIEHDLRYKGANEDPEHISKEIFDTAAEIAAIDKEMQRMYYEIQSL